jgi:hypothetical protein
MYVGLPHLKGSTCAHSRAHLSVLARAKVMEEEARLIAAHIIGEPRALATDAPTHTLLAYDRRMTLHAPPDTGCSHYHKGGVSGGGD